MQQRTFACAACGALVFARKPLPHDNDNDTLCAVCTNTGHADAEAERQAMGLLLEVAQLLERRP